MAAEIRMERKWRNRDLRLLGGPIGAVCELSVMGGPSGVLGAGCSGRAKAT